jgi:hypothetical protein
LGLPVSRSNKRLLYIKVNLTSGSLGKKISFCIYRKEATGPTSLKTSINCSSESSKGMFPTIIKKSYWWVYILAFWDSFMLVVPKTTRDPLDAWFIIYFAYIQRRKSRPRSFRRVNFLNCRINKLIPSPFNRGLNLCVFIIGCRWLTLLESSSLQITKIYHVLL